MPTKIWRENNKEKLRQYRREWYYKNKSHAKKMVVERKKERQKDIKEYICNYKSLHPCKCGETHPACLDFHHNDPDQKEINLAKAAVSGWGLEKVKNEIEKCIVLCSNCHRKLHWDENRRLM